MEDQQRAPSQHGFGQRLGERMDSPAILTALTTALQQTLRHGNGVNSLVPMLRYAQQEGLRPQDALIQCDGAEGTQQWL